MEVIGWGVRLIPCPECARHVRADAATCPFCDGVLASGAASRARVGALLIGAAAITTLGACGRMAVKYGAPAPPREPDTRATAPAEPEGPDAPEAPEAPEAPDAPDAPDDEAG